MRFNKWVAMLTFALSLTLVIPGTADAQVGGPRLPPGLDGEFMRVAEQLPGFGGYFFDANGDLNVYLTDVSRAAEASTLLAVVAAHRPPRRYPPYEHQATVVVRHATYDFPSLYAIKSRIVNSVARVADVEMFDIDEVNNHVTVGVTTEEARQVALQNAAKLGLPADGIYVEVIPTGHPIATLSDLARPVVGGVKISFVGSDNVTQYDCTLGANAWYGNSASGVNPPIPAGTPGFFTASHCSKLVANMAIVNGQNTYQGNQDGTFYTQGAAVIGFERYDPPTFNNYSNLDCNAGYPQCRYSDAVFAQYCTGPNQGPNGVCTGAVDYSNGYFEKTLSAGVGPGVSGSTQLSGLLFAANTYVSPVIGMTLEKVGFNTGWTEGQVVQGNQPPKTCIDQINRESNIEILCSYWVAAAAARGDSGAPVFELVDSNNNVAFAGIAWYAADNASYYLFSTEDSIKKDFGLGVNFLTH